eukprot:1157510-Pelagomonas_calceolata.AAC.24
MSDTSRQIGGVPALHCEQESYLCCEALSACPWAARRVVTLHPAACVAPMHLGCHLVVMRAWHPWTNWMCVALRSAAGWAARVAPVTAGILEFVLPCTVLLVHDMMDVLQATAHPVQLKSS